MIITIRTLYPDQFAWLPEDEGLVHFDRLIGSSDVREQIDSGEPDWEHWIAKWAEDCRAFEQARQSFLLYP